jgi:hypothetical protein
MTERSGEEATPQEATGATPDELAAALQSLKKSSPSLAKAIDDADVTPGDLAKAHDRATPDDPPAEHS